MLVPENPVRVVVGLSRDLQNSREYQERKAEATQRPRSATLMESCLRMLG